MQYDEQSPFYRLLITRYDEDREDEAIAILNEHPELATLTWPGPDEQGRPYVNGSTALHYAANDGKVRLMSRLIELGADVNASVANWYRSVLSWAANNARIEAIRLLLEKGADPTSLDALHAAAWGGSSQGADVQDDYVSALKLLIEAGADVNDRRYHEGWTPLRTAIESGHEKAIEFLRSIGAADQ